MFHYRLHKYLRDIRDRGFHELCVCRRVRALYLALVTETTKTPFSSKPKTKNFQDFLSHQILRHMHGVLNVDEKKLITQLAEKS